MSVSGLHDYGKLVDFPVQRRLFSLLDGRHQGTGAGASHEFLDMAEYKPGDDITDIDWKASARHNQPILKRFESTATLNVELIFDSGSNMAGAAPSGESKADIAGEIATALAWMTSVRGDHMGLVAGNSDNVRTLPARSGLSHSEAAVEAVRRVSPQGGGPIVPQLLRRAETLVHRRSMIFLVTDFAQVTPVLRPHLRRLMTRHSVFVLLVEDLDPTTAGGAELRDVDFGDLPDFVGEDQRLAMEWSRVIQNQRAYAQNELRALGVRSAAVSSMAAVLDSLVEVLGGGRRGALSA